MCPKSGIADLVWASQTRRSDVEPLPWSAFTRNRKTIGVRVSLMTSELDIAPAQLQRLDKGTAGPQQAVLPCGCQLDQRPWLLPERIMAVVLGPCVCASAAACHGFHVTSSLILCLSFQGCNVYRLGRSWSYLQLTRFQLVLCPDTRWADSR